MCNDKKLESQSVERSFDIFESFQKAVRYIDDLGFSYRFMSTEGNICTTAVFLNHDGPILEEVEALGKGIGLQSFVSAICEAIEHYIHDNLFLQATSKFSSATQLVKENPDILKDMGFCMLFTEDKLKEANIKTIDFIGVGHNDKLDFPAFLLEPAYLEDYPKDYWKNDAVANAYYNDEAPFAVKYSTNSGSALGFNFNDSVLHGLLEVIERDAHSLFQIRTTFLKKWTDEFVVNPNSVDSNIKFIWDKVEKLIGQKVILFDVTTKDIGIPVYLALPAKTHPTHGGLHGCGCSLYPSYAIERALLEILQVYQARGTLLESYAITNHKKDMNDLLEYIKHFGGAIDGPYVEKVVGTNHIDMLTEKCNKIDIRKNPAYMNTIEQIDYIVKSLIKVGFKPYKKVIDCDGVFLSHIIIPGLEKFNCIEYCVIAPGERGQKLMNS